MSILIVDDSAESRLLIRTYLTDADYLECLEAANGRECCENLVAAISGGATTIDLIILDILMPDPDGIALLKRIKAMQEYKHVPVLMVTADQSPERLSAAFACGASDYMTKPLKRVELLARVRAALRLKEQIDCSQRREQELVVAAKQLQLMNEKLRQMTAIDGLTGIPNRRSFDEFLAKACREVSSEQMICLILLDVDCFKLYNDAYGHVAGDEVLRKIAQAINSLATENQLAARYGGEEFVLVARDLSLPDALAAAESLRIAVESLKLRHEHSPVAAYVTVSVGLTWGRFNQQPSPEDLIHYADQALYLSKRNGRNRVTLGELAKNPNDM
ncbi:MAG: diguanylate cyclase [Sporomusaceae bacterium]|nr:diguanylate cyclase [Sporomusaceae bacterium]